MAFEERVIQSGQPLQRGRPRQIHIAEKAQGRARLAVQSGGPNGVPERDRLDDAFAHGNCPHPGVGAYRGRDIHHADPDARRQGEIERPVDPAQTQVAAVGI